jgi:hypothetical protein
LAKSNNICIIAVKVLKVKLNKLFDQFFKPFLFLRVYKTNNNVTMKKLLLILCCAMVLLSVSSCTKQYVNANQNQTVYATLASTDWVAFTDPGGVKSFQAPINVPQLDNASSHYDGIIVSISYDGGNTYEQLPEVYGNLSYTYTYNAGNITLYAQTPDGTTAVQPTDAMKVKIVLVYSN